MVPGLGGLQKAHQVKQQRAAECQADPTSRGFAAASLQSSRGACEAEGQVLCSNLSPLPASLDEKTPSLFCQDQGALALRQELLRETRSDGGIPPALSVVNNLSSARAWHGSGRGLCCSCQVLEAGELSTAGLQRLLLLLLFKLPFFPCRDESRIPRQTAMLLTGRIRY